MKHLPVPVQAILFAAVLVILTVLTVRLAMWSLEKNKKFLATGGHSSGPVRM